MGGIVFEVAMQKLGQLATKANRRKEEGERKIDGNKEVARRPNLALSTASGPNEPPPTHN